MQEIIEHWKALVLSPAKGGIKLQWFPGPGSFFFSFLLPLPSLSANWQRRVFTPNSCLLFEWSQFLIPHMTAIRGCCSGNVSSIKTKPLAQRSVWEGSACNLCFQILSFLWGIGLLATKPVITHLMGSLSGSFAEGRAGRLLKHCQREQGEVVSTWQKAMASLSSAPATTDTGAQSEFWWEYTASVRLWAVPGSCVSMGQQQQAYLWEVCPDRGTSPLSDGALRGGE